MKPEAQLTAEETTNGHKEGQHVRHPPRVYSPQRNADGQE